MKQIDDVLERLLGRIAEVQLRVSGEEKPEIDSMRVHTDALRDSLSESGRSQGDQCLTMELSTKSRVAAVRITQGMPSDFLWCRRTQRVTPYMKRENPVDLGQSYTRTSRPRTEGHNMIDTDHTRFPPL